MYNVSDLEAGQPEKPAPGQPEQLGKMNHEDEFGYDGGLVGLAEEDQG